MADVIDSNASAGDAATAEAPTGFVSFVVDEVLGSYTNIALVAFIIVLLYKILRSRSADSQRSSAVPEPELPKLRRDFTIQELKQYDGNQPDGRVLMSVNGNIYDVTRGKRFYGPGELYMMLG